MRSGEKSYERCHLGRDDGYVPCYARSGNCYSYSVRFSHFFHTWFNSRDAIKLKSILIRLEYIN